MLSLLRSTALVKGLRFPEKGARLYWIDDDPHRLSAASRWVTDIRHR